MSKKDIKKLVIIFFIGLVVGVIFLNGTNIENKRVIYEYIKNYIENISKIRVSDICNVENIYRNSIIITTIFLSGFFVFGKTIIYLANFSKGFILGFTISSIVGSIGGMNGVIAAISVLLIQNLVEIPLIIFFSLISMMMTKDIKSINNNEKFRKKVTSFIIAYLFTECINITSLLINVYFSSNFVKIIKFF